MNRFLRSGGAIATVAVALGALLLLGTKGREPTTRHRSLGADPELMQLAPAPKAETSSAVGQAAKPASSVVAPMTRDSRGPLSPAAQRSQQGNSADDERKQFIAEQVAAQYETDPPPNAVSRALESTLKGYFEPHVGKGMTLEQLDCKERLCRAKVLFDSVADDINVLADVLGKFTSEPGHGGMMAPEREYLTTGKVRTLVYMAQHGDIEVFE